MKRVVELIRVSTAAQAAEDRAGIPAQREANRKTAKAYGLDIVRTIEIVDVSGSAVLACPEMGELLQAIESPEIDGVVAKEFSRLMRPERFSDFALLEVFCETRTSLYLPEGEIDLRSHTGRFMGTIRAAVAGLERSQILGRMQDAKESIRKAGKHTGGSTSLPFGVGYSRQKGWHYTPEAEKVKDAFSMFLTGRFSCAQIARTLNIPRTSIRYILENKIYTGWKVYDQKRDPSASGYVAGKDGRQGYRKKIERSPDEMIRNRVLHGIVHEDQFARTQEMLAERREKQWRSRAGSTGRYTYNGFLTCGECGELLYTHASKQDFYLCKTRNTRERQRRSLQHLEPCTNRYMLRGKLEPKLDCLVGEKFRDPDFVQRLLAEYKRKLLDASQPRLAEIDQAAIEAKLKELGERENRILEAFFEGVIDRQKRNESLESVQRETSVYQSLLEKASPPHATQLTLGLNSVLRVLEPFSSWAFLGREDRRALLEQMCPEISVYRYTVQSLKLKLGGVNATAQSDRDTGRRMKTDASPLRALHSP